MRLWTTRYETSRRNFLQFGALAMATTAMPAKLWASIMRPDAAFKAQDLNSTFAELGATPEKSNGITLTAPKAAENAAIVQVKVEIDDSKLEGVSRLYLLAENNPNPLCGVFVIPEGTKPYLQTRVKIARTCNLYAVAEVNGGLFMTAQKIEFNHHGLSGFGNSHNG